ncbi:EEIG1/EHBP1 protein amino-terminal domain protein [Perilla frutescens var. hirtella]|uniref:EEIG1/EHBP1 protein amino-terminal domain protein n=1 Tax=Perilla frutescens var. hirtella TaxID=608512 RepID=A0AAD4JFI4_PERFH|nr:EEIG1/EHBP1 protein amino-terminal domain protein [Perilla frutescens var. hirtella]
MIQWEHAGDRSCCGSTNEVVPAGDGRIQFNESFRLLLHKSNNCIEFNLYEPRNRDKSLKGHLLGTAVLDLAAAYGVDVIKDDLSITTPINCKRTYNTTSSNSSQPLLFLKIHRKINHHDQSVSKVQGFLTRENHEKCLEGREVENEVLNEFPQVDMFKERFCSSTERSRSRSTSNHGKPCRKVVSDEGRIGFLENRVKKLEGELREVAALEVSLYSVVAEHGSSVNKVHAPARRLSRLYFHANNRATASKSVVSGLVLVAQACGNDVPRLTFWLSNTIVLRAIICKSNRLPFPAAFVAALEKVESWMFSRIVESLWWQSFTPRMQMQSTSTDASMRKSQQQGNFSLQLWKRAFSDACQRICPVRGGGHHSVCGCLPLLSTMIMEQLVARLDVAMFNAILRESGDEIPSDPVADPISDAKVLPIPAGKASFGAGVQLKNAIGNWSRWLSNIEDLVENGKRSDDETSSNSKTFSLLNALSDLMMLPKDMLLRPSIRKEVCPAFPLPLLTRILNFFVPDEFCPDPIPRALLEALNTEEDSEVESPCEVAAAAPIVYLAPSVDSVATTIMGGVGTVSGTCSRSLLLKKSQTSDDELDQLSSPLKAINIIIRSDTPTTTARYQLLREVWKE